MSEEIFLLPDVGEGLIEAEIVVWKVSVGDAVVLNQALVDVETAKAVVELPSPFAGVIRTLHGEVGDMMEVNAPLVTFDVEGDASPSRDTAQVDQSEASDVSSAREEPRREAVLTGYGVADESLPVRRRRRPRVTSAPITSPVASVTPSFSSTVRTTPPVRLLAKQRGLDLSTIRGTGPGGVITRADVETAPHAGENSDATWRREARPALSSLTGSRFMGREIASWGQGAREERIAVKGVARAMAEAMLESTTQQPQAVVWSRVDVTKSMELLRSLKAHPRFIERRLSPLTLIALGVCDAARHHPGINSSFDARAQEVVVRRFVNLGIAADTPRGLLVPNVKDADQLDVGGMATALSALVTSAREGTLTPADMLGTTLTITNVGPFKVDAAMAILPPGTGAIICVGKIGPAPWVSNNELCVRDVVEISMTFDHRQIDGALASRVLAHVAGFLEDPAPALLAL